MPLSERQIKLASHTIGLDSKNPYKRHGKLFYRPYRNFFTTHAMCGDIGPWMGLVYQGYANMRTGCQPDSFVFWLTREGMDALGKILGMTIHDVR